MSELLLRGCGDCQHAVGGHTVGLWAEGERERESLGIFLSGVLCDFRAFLWILSVFKMFF